MGDGPFCGSATSCARYCSVLSKHKPDVQILRLCPGPSAAHSMLFLEIIGDLLEKQEALGLLVYIVTFFCFCF